MNAPASATASTSSTVVAFTSTPACAFPARTASITSCALALYVIEVPPGATHARSWSRRSDKYYLVTRGAISFSLDDQRFELAAGDFCLVRQGQRFDYRNQAGELATLVLVHTPSFELDAEVFEED